MIKNKIKSSNRKFLENTMMQYVMTVAQVVFPFITFPYITRTIGAEAYGVITFLAATVMYFQLFVGFGFDLSATKKIAEKQHDLLFVGSVLGTITQAKIFLFSVSVIIYAAIIPFIEIMRENILLSCLYMVNIFITIFLPDYMFRGIEKMRIITVRFVIARTISTVLIFAVVKSPEDLILIPVIEIMGSLLAVALTLYQIRKLNIHFISTPMKKVFVEIKESSIYFLSTFATTAFGATNTFLLGVMTLSPVDIAYWGVSNKMITSAQSLYSPIVNSLYPRVAANKDFSLPKKVLLILMPPIIIVSCLLFVFSEQVIVLIGGPEYVGASIVFRALIPVLVISFPVLVIGFPVLGNLGRVKETTVSTIVAACFHVFGLIVLIATKKFNILNIAILRSGTEILMLVYRVCVLKNHYRDKVKS